MKEIEKTTLEGSFHGQRCFLCESQHVKSGKKGKIEKKENDLRWEVLLSVNYDDFLGLFTEKRGGWSFYIILLILISLAYFKFMFIIHSHQFHNSKLNRSLTDFQSSIKIFYFLSHLIIITIYLFQLKIRLLQLNKQMKNTLTILFIVLTISSSALIGGYNPVPYKEMEHFQAEDESFKLLKPKVNQIMDKYCHCIMKSVISAEYKIVGGVEYRIVFKTELSEFVVVVVVEGWKEKVDIISIKSFSQQKSGEGGDGGAKNEKNGDFDFQNLKSTCQSIRKNKEKEKQKQKK